VNKRIEELIKQATVDVPLYYGPAGFYFGKEEGRREQ